MRLIKAACYNPGDQRQLKKEERIANFRFSIHKFTPRPRPRSRDVVIFSLFSEFGSETLAPLYCIPQLMQSQFRGRYTIVMGWLGRAYLYKHLVDEFWELGEEWQYLREYCRAFHHESKNLRVMEEKAKEFGHVIPSAFIGNIAVYPKMEVCSIKVNALNCGGQVIFDGDNQICVKCGTSYPRPGLFDDVTSAKKRSVWLPSPSQEKINYVQGILKKNSVGITARNRRTYSRNLPPRFYERLIYLLEDMGYNPVWIGERVTTLACPDSRIVDFSRMPEAQDLETTLALVSQLRFTVQFWTASTRLAGFVGTPFLLFESPEQIWKHQEGLRLSLCSKGPKKVIAAHFKNVLNNQGTALNYIKSAIFDMESGNYSPIVGQVDDEKSVRCMMIENNNRIGF